MLGGRTDSGVGLARVVAPLVAAALALAGIAAAATAQSVVVGDEEAVRAEFALSPKALPKKAPRPVALSFGASVEPKTAVGATSPATGQLVLHLDRNIVLGFKGLPSCGADLVREIDRNIDGACAKAIVGRANVEFYFPSREGLPTPAIADTAFVLNGGRRGAVRTLYLVSIERTPNFTVVLPIRIRPVDDGRYGRELRISVPEVYDVGSEVAPLVALGFTFAEELPRDGVSVATARCPAGKLLMNTEFRFADGTETELLSARSCEGQG